MWRGNGAGDDASSGVQSWRSEVAQYFAGCAAASVADRFGRRPVRRVALCCRAAQGSKTFPARFARKRQALALVVARRLESLEETPVRICAKFFSEWALLENELE